MYNVCCYLKAPKLLSSRFSTASATYRGQMGGVTDWSFFQAYTCIYILTIIVVDLADVQVWQFDRKQIKEQMYCQELILTFGATSTVCN